MSKMIYNLSEIKTLENNPNIKSVTERSITYSSEFKRKAIKQSPQGMTSTQIFELAGLPSHLIGEGKSDQSLSRWKRSYKDHGEDVLLQEALDKANARIAYLEGNLELVKKL
ncbi:hypothetical protein ACN2AU_10355, partial [Aerococcus viridans]